MPGPAESQSRHSDPMCGGLVRKWRPSSMNMANAARAVPASTNCRMRDSFTRRASLAAAAARLALYDYMPCRRTG